MKKRPGLAHFFKKSSTNQRLPWWVNVTYVTVFALTVAKVFSDMIGNQRLHKPPFKVKRG